MRSGTSFFNGTIFRKDLKRFWPIWAVSLAVWLIALPLNGLMKLPTAVNDIGFIRFASRYVLDVCGQTPAVNLIFAIPLGLLTAMAACSHLYNNRSANFMASLPVRREGQFLSHYAAGAVMMILPNVAVMLLTLLVEAIGGAVFFAPIGFWAMYQSVLNFFFFSFAMCIGMFAGHIIALPVYFAVFNVIAVAAYLLRLWVMEAFYYGYRNVNDLPYVLAQWFTPAWALSEVELRGVIDETSLYSSFYDGGAYDGYVMANGGILLVYAVAAVLLGLCAMLLYRKRRMESAGDAVAVKAMRPVFRYGVAICAGLALGFVTAAILGDSELSIMFWMVVWGVVGAFVAQMFLDKSFRVFKKWKGAVGVAVAFLVMFAVIGFDFTGYETRVPDADRVAAVTVGGLSANDGGTYVSLSGVEITDPELIKVVVALHEDVVTNRHYQEASEYNSGFSVSYTLKDGSVLARSYHNVTMTGKRYDYVRQLLADRELVRQAYGLDVLDEYEWKVYEARVEIFDAVVYGSHDFYADIHGKLVLDAVLKDFEEGNIGNLSLGYNDKTGMDTDVLGQLSFVLEGEPNVYRVQNGVAYDYSPKVTHRINIGLTREAVHTLKALALCNELPEDLVDYFKDLAGG